ncbi:MAG: MMPL family transporter, partial [Candidatus Saccharibacteria bacterium]|nr:MMPL family transporter [Candidatus Saccharibacteria bacterium]
TIEPKTIDVAYIYHGSKADYNEDWTMTVEEFVNYLNNNILQDTRLSDLISDEKKADIISAKDTIAEAKEMLVGKNYSRAIFNTYLEPEGDKTFDFIRTLKSVFSENSSTPSYVIGNSPMALEMSETFNDEMNLITILTMVAIFVVVAVTFRSIIIPVILVLIIQTAVWVTMATVSFTGEPLYFISLIIVQSILMGATIDYAILYTSYYLENRRKGVDIRNALVNSYSSSIHTILCSASVLVIVTAIVGNLASAIAAKICITISEGTLFSAILILVMLPAILAAIDKLIVRKKGK